MKTASSLPSHELPVSEPSRPSAQPVPSPVPTPASLRLRLWDWPLRLFHWALAVAVTVAIVTGKLGGSWMDVHGYAGLTIVGLVAFRLVWGVVGPRHARFVSFLPTPGRLLAYLRGRWQGLGHNPLGALSVVALLGLLAVQSVSGLFTDDEISFTGPLYRLVDGELAIRITGWHHQLGDLVLILVGLHVAAIVFYLVFKRTNLVGPMITGWKVVRRGGPGSAGRGAPGSDAASGQDAERLAREGSRVRWWALLLAVAAGAGAVYVASGRALPEEEAAPVSAPAASLAPAW